jgi:hypothetical protein
MGKTPGPVVFRNVQRSQIAVPSLKRAHGKKHAVVKAAYTKYKTTCKKARA